MTAYDETYLQPARTNLGRMLDVAVDSLGFGLAEFYGLFLASGLARRFGKGDYTLIAGCSGAELAFHVLDEVRLPSGNRPAVRYRYDRSPEFWCGWALARYQWKTALSFDAINRFAPIDDIALAYNLFHEMDDRQFDDWMEARRALFQRTPLCMRRMAAGLSQSQLARESGIPVRSIQQYEQRRKDLNKAAAETVVALARALFCSVEDLME